jgi:hypothetical protein
VIPACKLWERTSGKTGRPYLIGRLGGLRVLILENSRREGAGDASHLMMIAEAPAYDGTRNQAAPTEPLSSAPANGHQHRNGRRPRLDEDGVTLEDDPIPF